MNKFQNVETSSLIEMLAQHTQQLTSMLLSAVTAKEYSECKRMMEELQLEINLRWRQSENTTSTLPEVSTQTDTTV